MTEKEILDGIAYVRACLEAIHNEASERSEDQRNLTDEEQARWDEGMVFVDDAEKQLARVRELSRLSKFSTESGDAPQIMKRVESFDGRDVSTLSKSEARDKALKTLEDRDSTRHLNDGQLEDMERLLRKQSKNTDGADIARRLLVTETEDYRSAFVKLSANPMPVLSPEEGRAVEAWNEYRAASSSDTAGGFGVPVLIDPTIILTGQESPNDILAISRVETITTDAWKGVSSAGVTWSIDAEASEVSDDAPTLAQPSVSVYSARGFIPYSIEIGQDYPGFASEMGRLLAEGYSELVAEKLTTGSGSGPQGIVTALDANTNVEVHPATDGSFGPVDVYSLWDALPIKYRRNARWLSSTDVQNEIRQFGTSDGHQFTVNLTQEDIPRLFGHPYHLNDFMADFTGTTGASAFLVVGDFSNFLVAQRAGMTVELVPHLFHVSNNRPSGQRGWFAHARFGSDSINDLGFRLLVNE